MISLIVAQAKNRMIGKEGDFPWYLSDDLKRFRRLTIGKNIIMGRGNYDHLMQRLGKMLPDRTSIVVTRNKDFRVKDVTIVHSLEDAFKISDSQNQEVFVVGGAKMYESALPFVDRIYLTEVDAEFEGDAFFPALSLQDWKIASKEDRKKDEKNEYNYSWIVLDRKK